MLQTDLQRIEHILDYCIRVRETVSRYGASYETFLGDQDYQQSVAFSLLQIGELSGKLSIEFRKATSGRIQWAPMKAMRNIVVHNYGSVDREIIWETATIDIPALQAFCEEQLAVQ